MGVGTFPADHRHELFTDKKRGDLLPAGRGRPSLPAAAVAVACIMVRQAIEGLAPFEWKLRFAHRRRQAASPWVVLAGGGHSMSTTEGRLFRNRQPIRSAEPIHASRSGHGESVRHRR